MTYKIAKIKKENIAEIVGNLDNISNKQNKELGAFVKVLICNSIIELGGRIMLAEESASIPNKGLHDKAIRKMLTVMAEKTGNPNYKNK